MEVARETLGTGSLVPFTPVRRCSMSMALYLRLRSPKGKMSNYISLLLEAEAANRRLARLFRSEDLDRASQQSISMVTHDSHGAARREENNKMPQENRHE